MYDKLVAHMDKEFGKLKNEDSGPCLRKRGNSLNEGKKTKIQIRNKIKDLRGELKAFRKAGDKDRVNDLNDEIDELEAKLANIKESTINEDWASPDFLKLSDELMPPQGPAETIEGELVRAVSRIIYRFYNDGDKFYKGYGVDTAGGPAVFLISMGKQLSIPGLTSEIESMALDRTNDQGYEDALERIEKIVTAYIKGKNGEYTPNIFDMLDSQYGDAADSRWGSSYDDDDYDDEDESVKEPTETKKPESDYKHLDDENTLGGTTGIDGKLDVHKPPRVKEDQVADDDITDIPDDTDTPIEEDDSGLRVKRHLEQVVMLLGEAEESAMASNHVGKYSIEKIGQIRGMVEELIRLKECKNQEAKESAIKYTVSIPGLTSKLQETQASSESDALGKVVSRICDAANGGTKYHGVEINKKNKAILIDKIKSVPSSYSVRKT